ncbi:TOMM precursor leader peptide-binding protein [Cohnella thermotolerans]|uniref:TOMM precursor leader peptide-binding protein n=1 Tax=Cohnella thermotolerans TaxID=329858 RepID=UPI0003F8EEE3|nr:TOMM precursor leader peptide-binding protein [Cohnella thermotolerans]
MKPCVVIAGANPVADMMRDALADRCAIVRRTDIGGMELPGADLAVVAAEDDGSYDHSAVEQWMRQAGIPWIRILLSAEEAWIGPLVRPNEPGCSLCADTRRFTAKFSFGPKEPRPERSRGQGVLSRLALWHVARLAAVEIEKTLQARDPRTAEHMYNIRLDTLSSSLHFILPDPMCPICGERPEDTAEKARIVLQPRPKAHRHRYRLRPIDGWTDTLRKHYYDERTGLINERYRDLASPFASVSVHLPSFVWGSEVAGGRTLSFAASEAAAILEGVERRCGQAPLGKRTFVFGSYNELADAALDPARTGLHAHEAYDSPGFPFEPYDPDAPIDWVWGYSFLRERPILVPQQLAYYGTNYGDAFVQEGSNGCALGGCPEEAILYGMLEVVERDAFLLTWYARLPVPRLDPASANDAELTLMIERLRAVAGYEAQLYNMTTENGIPCVLALAKTVRPGRMNLLCAAAAHPHPASAAKSALHELSAMAEGLQMRFESNREKLRAMLHDPSLVTEMEHHALLYGLPEAEERLRFLLDSDRPMRTFGESFKRTVPHPDLTEDLKEAIETFRRLGLDVIVVDQTSPEAARNGLHCVKVFIPGMLPMTFGHAFVRLTGLERVLRIPAELGYANGPLDPKELNPHPHPFP